MKKSNKYQKTILFIGFVLFILINLFPPWKAITNPPDYNESARIGYSFLLTPPHSPYGYESYVVINYLRLFMQWGILIVLTLIIFFVTGRKSKS